MSYRHNQRLVGTELTVLVEGHDKKEQHLTARTEGKLIVRFESDDPELIGKFVTVRIDRAAPLSMEGSFVRAETPDHELLSTSPNR
jgi:tRNA-2-methylthio-N6-dimethylallyladenosine synthase